MNCSLSVPSKTNIKVPHGNILVNKKWRGSEVAVELGKAARVNIVYSDSMGFVDFFPSDSTPIIYVTEVELLTGRSFVRRIDLLYKEYQHKGIIFVDLSSSPDYEQLQSMCIDLELTLVTISSQAEIPPLLASFSYVESKLPSNPFKNSPQNAEKNLEREQVAILKSIPNVGDINALKLLKSYGHIKAIASLSEARLASKVGQPLANTIYRHFRDKVHL